jgi:hypothetical protein
VPSILKKKEHTEYWWGKLDEGEHAEKLGVSARIY